MKTTTPKRLSITEDEIKFYTNLDFEDHSNWWVPLHGVADDYVYDQGRDSAYEFMKGVAKEKRSKNIHWHSAYTVKHDVERWSTGNPHHCYVSKDMAISAALLVGLPVTIKIRGSVYGHEIGMYMTETQYVKFLAEIKAPRPGQFNRW